MGDVLVVKKEKRLARPGLGVTGVSFVTGGMVPNGSDFSLVGEEGSRPILMGEDSPWNQPASLLDEGSFLTSSVWLPVSKDIESRFNRVGECCGDLEGE